jgi:hypothetical protein
MRRRPLVMGIVKRTRPAWWRTPVKMACVTVDTPSWRAFNTNNLTGRPEVRSKIHSANLI